MPRLTVRMRRRQEAFPRQLGAARPLMRVCTHPLQHALSELFDGKELDVALAHQLARPPLLPSGAPSVITDCFSCRAPDKNIIARAPLDFGLQTPAHALPDLVSKWSHGAILVQNCFCNCAIEFERIVRQGGFVCVFEAQSAVLG